MFFQWILRKWTKYSMWFFCLRSLSSETFSNPLFINWMYNHNKLVVVIYDLLSLFYLINTEKRAQLLIIALESSISTVCLRYQQFVALIWRPFGQTNSSHSDETRLLMDIPQLTAACVSRPGYEGTCVCWMLLSVCDNLLVLCSIAGLSTARRSTSLIY